MIRLSETVLAELDLSLWAGPGSDPKAIERALDWEAEVARESAFPSVGLVVVAERASTEAFRAMIATLVLSRGIELFVTVRFRDGLPEAADLDPRKAGSGSVGDLRALFEEFGVAHRVEISDRDHPAEDLRALADRCDYVGILRPGCWLQPRGGFALGRFLARKRPDFLLAGCVSFDPSNGKRVRVERVPEDPRFAVLGGDVLGPCPLLRAPLWEAVSAEKGSAAEAWWDTFHGPWGFGGMATSLPGVKVKRLRLHVWATFAGRDEASRSQPSGEFVEFLRQLAPRLGAGPLEIVPGGRGPEVLPVPQIDTDIGVVIPFRDERESTLATLRSMADQTVADRIHVVLVDNGSSPGLLEDLAGEAADLFEKRRVFPLEMEGAFNFARLNNRGEKVLPVECGVLVFSNNDVEMTDATDLGRLCACLSWEGVGMAGGRLVFPDGELQSAGLRMGPAGPQAVRSAEEGAFRFREVDGVSFALAACRREIFRRIGGLDEERCPNGFGDALFCHRVRALDWRILCVPGVVIRHFESKSRGRRPEEAEFADLCAAGIPTGVHFEDFSVAEGAKDEVLGRPPPSLGKRIYRSLRAFVREWKSGRE